MAVWQGRQVPFGMLCMDTGFALVTKMKSWYLGTAGEVTTCAFCIQPLDGFGPHHSSRYAKHGEMQNQQQRYCRCQHLTLQMKMVPNHYRFKIRMQVKLQQVRFLLLQNHRLLTHFQRRAQW
mmetsp:Transcript_24650/g.53704  ORF Transcript_24650/g.53704 Transcript_24650/m.53704 type:complete len:122 (+) Transcript_24650:96-461(+)